MALHSPRPDFDAALMQFLIGLLHTCWPNKTKSEWVQWLTHPPTPNELKTGMEKYAPAFEASCFMQDYELVKNQSQNSTQKNKRKSKSEDKNVATLLIPFPGEQTNKENKDHFIKRTDSFILCAPCAMTALFTLQVNAPSGGRGYLTSMRGGGPLTTLIAVDNNKRNPHSLIDNLWCNIWLNVLNADDDSIFYRQIQEYERAAHRQEAAYSNPAIFPWLGPTRTSETESSTKYTRISDIHPLQVYWGMSRRICIDWCTNIGPGVNTDTSAGAGTGTVINKNTDATEGCSLCGEASTLAAKAFTTKTYGVNYEDISIHPLSPYRYFKKNNQWNSQKAQLDGILYKDWPDIAISQESSDAKAFANRCAMVVTRYHEYDLRQTVKMQLCLHVFGYDMDNMKARAWHEGKMPLFQVAQAAEFEALVRNHLIKPASESANELYKQVKNAFKDVKEAKPPSHLKWEFFQKTQATFFNMLHKLKNLQPENEKSIPENYKGKNLEDEKLGDKNIEDKNSDAVTKQTIELSNEWLGHLKNMALQLFDFYAPIDYNLRPEQIRRIVKARNNLEKQMRNLLNPLVGKKKQNLAQKEKTE